MRHTGCRIMHQLLTAAGRRYVGRQHGMSYSAHALRDAVGYSQAVNKQVAKGCLWRMQCRVLRGLLTELETEWARTFLVEAWSPISVCPLRFPRCAAAAGLTAPPPAFGATGGCLSGAWTQQRELVLGSVRLGVVGACSCSRHPQRW